jgi:chorismate synthase
MSGSSYGKLFRVTTWGESHGSAIGVVVDGCPAGLALSESDIQQFLNRRKPGQSIYTTMRQEADRVEILSGVFEGTTTGTPISLLVRNEDQRSEDYGNLASVYRPGHADYTFSEKYGIRDYRGGGRSSGRETIGRVAAGAIASKILEELHVKACAFTSAVGPIRIPTNEYHFEEINQNRLYMPNNLVAQQACDYLDTLMESQDSCGGEMQCIVTGLPIGLGEPVFDKLDARLAQAVLSIGAVKAVEFGDGHLVSNRTGSQNNDAFCMQDGRCIKQTNHSGGVLGGISDGSPLIIRASVKPTPSIARTQHTVTQTGEEVDLTIHGRHDPIIVPRAVVVFESMIALTLVDLLLEQMTTRLDAIKAYYTEENNVQ